MRYDPECEYSRQHLAITIVSKLTESGFTRVEEDGARVSSTPWQVKEHLYERDIDDIGLKVQVYTTVVDENALGLTVRATGRDAIRVNVRSPKVNRALVTETRVNRTGEIDDIVERMIQRARDAYKLGRQSGKCHKCDSPRALSKAGKWYCAKVCWKTEDEKRRDTAAWKAKNYKPRRRSYYRSSY